MHGAIIGIYQPIEDLFKETSVQAKSMLPGDSAEHVSKCPVHVQALLKQARLVCKTE